jgi:hypothetical protein
MNNDSRPPECSACDQPFTTPEEIGFCVLCGNAFCARHLTLRSGVAHCAACEGDRLTKEQTGSTSDADVARIVHLLKNDVANTAGSGHETVVEEAAARLRLFTDNPADFERSVVDDVQQYFHDTFLDTKWPGCPDHPNHPLWYSEKWWRCERTGKTVAPLGRLGDEDTPVG